MTWLRGDVRVVAAAQGEPRTPAGRNLMDLRLELIPLPSRDVDASKAFYVDRVGFHLDHDIGPGNGMRIVQLTPPGSSCSVVIGVGMGDPGAAPVTGLHLVVDDIEAARAELSGRGVDVSGVDDMGGVKYAYFSDPDGNSWALQEIPGRRGRRFDHADLAGARFEHVDLTGARFSSVDLTGAEFRSVDIKHVQMRGVDLPWDEMPDTPGTPRDRAARPSLDEALALRHDRMATVRALVDGLTEESLAADTTPVDAPGWPPPQSFPVRECLLIVLNEEWEHRNYAERDLAVLEERSSTS